MGEAAAPAAVALLTCAQFAAGTEDDRLLARALAARGVRVVWVDWRQWPAGGFARAPPAPAIEYAA